MGYYTGVKAVLWDILNPIEATFLLKFIIFHLGYKNPHNKGRLAQIIYVIIWSVIIVVNGVVAPDVPASLIFNVFLLLWYAGRYLKGTVLKQIFWYMMSIIILALVDIVVFVIAIIMIREGDVYEIVMGSFTNRYIASIASITLFVVSTELYYMIRRRQSTNNHSVSYDVVMCASVAVVIIISFVYSLMNRGKEAKIVILFFVFLLVISIMLFVFEYYLWSIKENETRQKIMSMILAEDELIKQHYEQDSIIYAKMRRNMHDAKHHLSYLEYLSDSNDYDAVKNYIIQIKENN